MSDLHDHFSSKSEVAFGYFTLFGWTRKWKSFRSFIRALRQGTLDVDPVQCQSMLYYPSVRRKFFGTYRGWTPEHVGVLLDLVRRDPRERSEHGVHNAFLAELARNPHVDTKVHELLLSYALESGEGREGGIEQTPLLVALAGVYPEGMERVFESWVRTGRERVGEEITLAWAPLLTRNEWDRWQECPGFLVDFLSVQSSPRKLWPLWIDELKRQGVLKDAMNAPRETKEEKKARQDLTVRMVLGNPGLLDVAPEFLASLRVPHMARVRSQVSDTVRQLIDQKLTGTVRGVDALVRDGVTPTVSVTGKTLARVLARTSRQGAGIRKDVIASLGRLRGQ